MSGFHRPYTETLQTKALSTSWYRPHTGLEAPVPGVEDICDTFRNWHDSYAERQTKL